MPKVATEVDVDAVLDQLAARPDRDDVDGRILDAAGALLIAEGLAGLEVDRVAARSGVGRSTVYRRFDGRNALIAATVAHEARRFLTVLAGAVDPDASLEDRIVTAFSTGLRVARHTGLDQRLREEPLLLRLLTVDAGPIVAAARDQLVLLAASEEAAPVAELLIRLAISFVLTPDTVLGRDVGGDAGDGTEAALRHHLAPLLRPA